jgi:hypothetical protein
VPQLPRGGVVGLHYARVIKRKEVERRVLAALQRRFFTKERLDEWTRLYVAERNRLRAERRAMQADAPRELAAINARSKQILELLLNGFRDPWRGSSSRRSGNSQQRWKTRMPSYARRPDRRCAVHRPDRDSAGRCTFTGCRGFGFDVDGSQRAGRLSTGCCR